MPIVSMRQLLDHAAENGYGLPAFNVNNMEQVWAIMEAANELNAPVIMQASAGARKYAGEAFLRHQILAALEAYPHIPVVMHQDHGQSPAVCMAAIKSGFSSVMMDGSLQEDGKSVASYDYNVAVTQEVVKFSHAIGVSVEAELGVLGSLETMKADKEDGHGAEGHMTREDLLTDPDQAADFVARTNCDALAIAIGTSHGAYKFKGEAKLDFDRLEKVGQLLPGVPIVLHGASSVPQEFVDMANKYGGHVPGARGVPEDLLRKAASMAVCKINIDTDIRLAMTATIRKHMAENPADFDPRQYLTPARTAVKEMVQRKIKNVLGCSGKA